MPSQDLPGQDSVLQQEPEDVLEHLRERGRRDLFWFLTGVLGYPDLTPGCHMPLTVFIDSHPAQFKLAMMPRDHLKTTCATIGGTMQLVVRDPNQRILLANESATNASRFLRAIRQHAESNKIFRTLYGDVIPKDTRTVAWNESELTFQRDWRGPEPTIDTVGMTGSFTSRHYTHITCDDPISEEAIKSEKVMEDVISRFSSFLSLLVDPRKDTIWLIGTRWALHDIYSWAMANWGQFLAKFIRSATEDGQPIWPERFTPGILALKRASYGEYKYSALYMNAPRDEGVQDLNVRDLGYWRFTSDGQQVELYRLDGQDQLSVVETVPVARLDITTTVDLAPAEVMTSDRNAICTTGVTPRGHVVVLDMFAERCSPLRVLEYLLELKQRWHPRVFGIEGVAYQKAFKWFLKAEAEKRGLYLNIQELKATTKKEIRIRGLQPIMATRRLFIEPTQHLLRDEMAQFPLGKHDDCLDALAHQLSVWRGVLSPERYTKYRESETALLKRIHGAAYRERPEPGDIDYDLTIPKSSLTYRTAL